MKIIDFFANILFQQQKKLEILAIFLLCFCISFRFQNFDIKWLWNDYTFIAVILVMSIILIALIWIQIEKKKTSNLIQLIKNQTSINKDRNKSNLAELTARQKDVFDLIITGKSNKEIMNELCIELSTLKTHINKIYKILEIKSRRQLRNFKIEEN